MERRKEGSAKKVRAKEYNLLVEEETKKKKGQGRPDQDNAFITGDSTLYSYPGAGEA